MTRCSERQPLRLRVPDTPQIAAAHALPFLHTPAAIGWDAPHSRPQITTSVTNRMASQKRHPRPPHEPEPPPENSIEPAQGPHAARVQSNRVSASATLRRNSYFVRLRSPPSTMPE